MEEFLAIVIIVFPGILTVDHDGDNVGTFNSFQAGADVFKAVDHILCGVFTAHARIGETDFVRNDPVTEEDSHFFASFALNIIGTVERVWVGDGIGTIAGKAVALHAKRSDQNRFAGLHPLVTGFAH